MEGLCLCLLNICSILTYKNRTNAEKSYQAKVTISQQGAYLQSLVNT